MTQGVFFVVGVAVGGVLTLWAIKAGASFALALAEEMKPEAPPEVDEGKREKCAERMSEFGYAAVASSDDGGE